MLLIKNFIDKIVATILLVVLFPFLLIISLWLWIALRENPFFLQRRVGKKGKYFRIVKLKTIGHRKVKVLSFLRTTHIDELPQLFNILIGSMSLVGPRPHVPEHVAQYEPWQRERLTVKPGITCLRQLKSPFNKLEFYQNIEDDVKYAREWSVRLDLKILLSTVVAIFRLLVTKIYHQKPVRTRNTDSLS